MPDGVDVPSRAEEGGSKAEEYEDGGRGVEGRVEEGVQRAGWKRGRGTQTTQWLFFFFGSIPKEGGRERGREVSGGQGSQLCFALRGGCYVGDRKQEEGWSSLCDGTLRGTFCSLCSD